MIRARASTSTSSSGLNRSHSTVRQVAFLTILGPSMKDFPISMSCTRIIEVNTKIAAPYKTHQLTTVGQPQPQGDTEYRLDICLKFDQYQRFFHSLSTLYQTFTQTKAFIYEVELGDLLDKMTIELNSSGNQKNLGFNLTKIKDLSEKSLF